MRAPARRTGYRRTRRVAAGVGVAMLLVAVAPEPGGAQTAGDFDSGRGNATAIGVKVNPIFGGLSFGVTVGTSIAGHQSNGSQGVSKAIDLGVIGVTLAGEGCDGGDPTLPAESQPQPVVADSGRPGASKGFEEAEAGVALTKFARAEETPFGEALTVLTPLGDPNILQIAGANTYASSGVVAPGIREARAVTEIGAVSLLRGAVKLTGLRWEAVHRSGAEDTTSGTFDIGGLVVAGNRISLPGDIFQRLEVVNDALELVGIRITAPKVREAQGVVFVDPLSIGLVPSEVRQTLLGPVFELLQPIRNALADKLIELDCGNSTYTTVLDLAFGTLDAAGRLSLELGGVQATTAEINRFSFGERPSLQPAGNDGGGSPLAPSGSDSTPDLDLGSSPTPTTAAPTTTTTTAPTTTTELPSEPASTDTAGPRGGALLAVALGGLALLLLTAEADRRKMRRAERLSLMEAR